MQLNQRLKPCRNLAHLPDGPGAQRLTDTRKRDVLHVVPDLQATGPFVAAQARLTGRAEIDVDLRNTILGLARLNPPDLVRLIAPANPCTDNRYEFSHSAASAYSDSSRFAML